MNNFSRRAMAFLSIFLLMTQGVWAGSSCVGCVCSLSKSGPNQSAERACCCSAQKPHNQQGGSLSSGCRHCCSQKSGSEKSSPDDSKDSNGASPFHVCHCGDGTPSGSSTMVEVPTIQWQMTWDSPEDSLVQSLWKGIKSEEKSIPRSDGLPTLNAQIVLGVWLV